MKTRSSKQKEVMRFRPALFWDVDPKTIDPKRNAPYVIERVIDFGNDREIRKMARTYPRSLIRRVVLKSRGIHPRSRALWKLLTRQ